jgi:hypothetical protein
VHAWVREISRDEGFSFFSSSSHTSPGYFTATQCPLKCLIRHNMSYDKACDIVLEMLVSKAPVSPLLCFMMRAVHSDFISGAYFSVDQEPICHAYSNSPTFDIGPLRMFQERIRERLIDLAAYHIWLLRSHCVRTCLLSLSISLLTSPCGSSVACDALQS